MFCLRWGGLFDSFIVIDRRVFHTLPTYLRMCLLSFDRGTSHQTLSENPPGMVDCLLFKTLDINYLSCAIELTSIQIKKKLFLHQYSTSKLQCCIERIGWSKRVTSYGRAHGCA